MDQKQTAYITRLARKLLADKEAMIYIPAPGVSVAKISTGEGIFDAMDTIWKMADQIVADHPEVPEDWRVGLRVKLKYRNDSLNSLLPNGMAGTVTSVTKPGEHNCQDPNGLICVKVDDGKAGMDTYITTGADRWITA
jgi:hypothetical protein